MVRTSKLVCPFLSVVFVAACSCFAQPEAIEKKAPSIEKRVENKKYRKVTAYTVSGEPYTRFVEVPTGTPEQIAAFESRKLERDKRLWQSFVRSNPSMVNQVAFFLESASGKDILEMPEAQPAVLEKILSEMDDTLENDLTFMDKYPIETDEDRELVDRMRRAKIKRNNLLQIVDELTPSQIETLTIMNVSRYGFPKLMTETPAGEAIGLSPTQRSSILKRSEILHKKMQSFMSDVRDEYRAILDDVLDDKQRKLLDRLSPHDSFEESVRTSEFERLIRYVDFTKGLPSEDRKRFESIKKEREETEKRLSETIKPVPLPGTNP